MLTDQLQTNDGAGISSVASPSEGGVAAHVDAGTLKRWTRAINALPTTPPMSSQPLDVGSGKHSFAPSALQEKSPDQSVNTVEPELWHAKKGSADAGEFTVFEAPARLSVSDLRQQLATCEAIQISEGIDKGPHVPPSTTDEPNITPAWPLRALRGLYAIHRPGRFEGATEAEDRHGGRAALGGVTSAGNASTDLLLSRTPSVSSKEPLAQPDGDMDASSGTDQLHALIESCCSRLWVNDVGSRAPQGVMLDLGRWMPGCTVEVAKAAGVLRITLRGVEGDHRQRVEEELQGLGDGLAKRLGCQVVAAVAHNKDSTQ
jgi:hypothetical protein